MVAVDCMVELLAHVTVSSWKGRIVPGHPIGTQLSEAPVSGCACICCEGVVWLEERKIGLDITMLLFVKLLLSLPGVSLLQHHQSALVLPMRWVLRSEPPMRLVTVASFLWWGQLVLHLQVSLV
jgi:hypothetical protein